MERMGDARQSDGWVEKEVNCRPGGASCNSGMGRRWTFPNSFFAVKCLVLSSRLPFGIAFAPASGLALRFLFRRTQLETGRASLPSLCLWHVLRLVAPTCPAQLCLWGFELTATLLDDVGYQILVCTLSVDAVPIAQPAAAWSGALRQ